MYGVIINHLKSTITTANYELLKYTYDIEDKSDDKLGDVSKV